MSSPDSISSIVEEQLRAGETSRARIVEAVLPAVGSMDCDYLRRFYADSRVSLAVGSMRDENGERVAFPSRDQHGKRTVVHTEHTANPDVLMTAAFRLMKHGRNMIKAGRRLAEKADLLRLELSRKAA